MKLSRTSSIHKIHSSYNSRPGTYGTGKLGSIIKLLASPSQVDVAAANGEFLHH